MSLFLLAETNQPNRFLKEKIRAEIASRGNRIAYVSSAPQDEERKYFERTKEDYALMRTTISLEYFDLSEAFTDEILRMLLDFGTIHLSGGNTYVFLEALRKRNMQSMLEEHRARNGLIIGVSAGAIALTPHIGTSELCGDVNEPSLTDLSGMSFVDFCFLPHLGTLFENTEENLRKAQGYAAQTGRELYVCGDSDGIFVDASGKIDSYGDLLRLDAEREE
ncbi:MAG: Type 1 glutamine amidotransferase-like domain-containing protein [Minisyncoccota bacterium]